METVDVRNKEYVTIREARAYIAKRSARWYRDRIKEGEITASSKGTGSDYLILTSSLLDYLESLSNI